MTTGLLLPPLSLPARQLLWIAYGFLSGFALSSQRWRTPGGSRLVAALPLLVLNLLAPLLFDGDTETLANFACAIATAFISNMKARNADAAGADTSRTKPPSSPLLSLLSLQLCSLLCPPPWLQVLGWIMGRGSLVGGRLSPAQFAAVYTLPITPAAGVWLGLAHAVSSYQFAGLKR